MSPNGQQPSVKCACQTRMVEGIAIVDLSGPLTLVGGADVVRSAVGELIQQGQPDILINCANVEQIDSAGVGELVSSHTAAARAGAALKLAGVHDRLENLIKLTGVGAMIEWFADEQTALASFRTAASK